MSPSQLVVSCVSSKVFYVLDCTLLVTVYIFQSSVLNFYIISNSKQDAASYFWFLGDIIMTGLFIYMSVAAYYYLKKQRIAKKEAAEDSPVQVAESKRSNYGVLPFCYITWICYASYLVLKIAYIFNSDVVNTVNLQDVFGPQLLKVSVAFSTVVFVLVVAAHHDAEKDSQRALAIKAACTSTSFELLDSMSFLSLLIIRESHLIVSYHLQNVIITFACLNYFLPTITLFQLCLTDFGQKEKPFNLDGIYHFTHLVLVNIPYLAVRIYLWSGFGADISLFVMKNVISIVWSLKDVVIDLLELHRQCLSRQQQRNQVRKQPEEGNEFVELERMN